MIKSKFRLFVFGLLLVSASNLNSQNLEGDELKSMEKYGEIGNHGIIAPDLRLSVEQIGYCLPTQMFNE